MANSRDFTVSSAASRAVVVWACPAAVLSDALQNEIRLSNRDSEVTLKINNQQRESHVCGNPL